MAKTQHRITLTPEQTAELEAYIAKHGRNWRSRMIMEDWPACRVDSLIYLRNTPGGREFIQSYKAR